jgi:uracil-DNA glycosylase
VSKVVQIEEGWGQALREEFEKPYFGVLRQFLLDEKAAQKIIYPPGSLIFNAFNQTPFEAVKVVILGQDPYHNPGEAMGLSFSVPRGIRVPPSLLNIYKELHRDLQVPVPAHGDLTAWAGQGVLLLNAFLTVEARKPLSHQKIGWHIFTDAVIRTLSGQKTGLVFMLWGNFAKSKKVLIDASKHTILESAHPSPLAGDAFQGCGHFSKANEVLRQQGETPISWNIT